MEIRQDIVFSLILAPIRSGLRGFRLTPPSYPPLPRGDEGGSMDYRQKKPLKYYPCLSLQVMNKVH